MYEKMIIKSKFKDYAINFIYDFSILLKREIESGSFTIVDSVVSELYLEEIKNLIPYDKILVIKATENNKTIDKCKEIIELLLEKKIRRNNRIIAIGGGVIQDITSFTASILYRGIDWIFFPTTLLAQSDSCIGSKTSINLGDKKNIIGNFYPPRDILLDINFLNTLSEDDIKSGIGEILHFFFYSNSQLIYPLIESYEDYIKNPKRLSPFIKESLKIKKAVIEVDEFDKDERNKFNFGHTFGHAIETITNYEIRHGQAVSIGMDIAGYLSLNFGLMASGVYKKMHDIVKINFPKYDWSNIDLDRYIDALSKDKKNIENQLGCILIKKPGELIKKQIPINRDLKGLISQYFKEIING